MAHRLPIGARTAALIFFASALSSVAFGQVFTSLYSFPFNSNNFGRNGLNPQSGVTVGPTSVLYGAATYGGPLNEGVVYELQPPSGEGGAWTQTVLFTFANYNGGYPDGSLAVASDGTLYGTTSGGGASAGCCQDGNGTVFQLTPPAAGGGAWTQTVIHNFSGADGEAPVAGVVIGPDGVLYGTTLLGGEAGLGEVFALHPPVNQGGSWRMEILHSFLGLPDGAEPGAPVTMGSDGKLYGTTETGGVYAGGYFTGSGAVYELEPPAAEGAGWTESVIHSFIGTDGSMPFSRVESGPDGVLFGTTSGEPGFGFNGGTVYELRPPAMAGGIWTENVLYTFSNGDITKGYQPESGVVLGVGGVLYGTTVSGGDATQGNMQGVVFALIPPVASHGAIAGEPWTETLLHSFAIDSIDGTAPAGELVGANGVLYGVTNSGGTDNAGTIFQVRH